MLSGVVSPQTRAPPQRLLQPAVSGRRVRARGSKKVVKIIKLAIDAGKANPSPPIGPALGAAGLNIMEFCKAYNAATQDKAGQVIPVEISVMDDRSFTFALKTPPASKLILQAAGIPKGSGTPQRIIATISEDQLREIAQVKLPDLNAVDVEAAMNVVHGTCRNMGVAVEGRDHRKPPEVAR